MRADRQADRQTCSSQIHHCPAGAGVITATVQRQCMTSSKTASVLVHRSERTPYWWSGVVEEIRHAGSGRSVVSRRSASGRQGDARQSVSSTFSFDSHVVVTFSSRRGHHERPSSQSLAVMPTPRRTADKSSERLKPSVRINETRRTSLDRAAGRTDGRASVSAS